MNVSASVLSKTEQALGALAKKSVAELLGERAYQDTFSKADAAKDYDFVLLMNSQRMCPTVFDEAQASIFRLMKTVSQTAPSPC